MALTIPHPHLHHPHTIPESLMITAAGVAVAALAAVGVYQIGDTYYQPDATSAVSSYLPGTVTQVDTFSPEATRANAASVNAFSPELARVAESPAVASVGESLATPNPAAKSATGTSGGSTSALNPAQAGAVSGPAGTATVQQVENSFLGLEN